MQETRVWSLGQEDSLEKGMVNYYIIVAWRIPWIEEPGRLQSTGSQRVRQDWLTVAGIRGEQLVAWWPASSHDISCSIMSSTESVIRTIPIVFFFYTNDNILLQVFFLTQTITFYYSFFFFYTNDNILL